MKTIIMQPEADRELEEAIQIYEYLNSGSADKLIDAFEKCKEQLLDHPDSGALLERGYRTLKIPRHRYTLYYEVSDDFIFIYHFHFERKETPVLP